jgi:hypothetical protein
MEWDELLRFHKSPPKCSFGRKHEVQALYDTHLVKHKSSAGISQHIRNTVLPHGTDWALVPNTFPYDVASNIEHMLLWTSDSTTCSTPDAILRSCGLKEYIYFENNPCNRSVKDIHHLHVFVKQNDQGISTGDGNLQKDVNSRD